MEEIEERFAVLEARIKLLEDREAIGRLICSWGPACDTGLSEEAASIWTDDGLLVSDMSRLEGPRGVLAMMESDGQQDLIRQGCAHVQGVPLISVEGDEARAINYSRCFATRTLATRSGGSRPTSGSSGVRPTGGGSHRGRRWSSTAATPPRRS